MFPAGIFLSPPVCSAFPLLVKSNVTTESANNVDDIRHRAMKVILHLGRGAVEARFCELGWGLAESARDVRGRGEAAAKERSFPTGPLVSRNHQGENFLYCEVVVAQMSLGNPKTIVGHR